MDNKAFDAMQSGTASDKMDMFGDKAPPSWEKSEFVGNVKSGKYGNPFGVTGKSQFNIDKDEGYKDLLDIGADEKSVYNYKKNFFKGNRVQGPEREYYLSGQGGEKGEKFLQAEAEYEFMMNQEAESSYRGRQPWE